MSRKRVTELFPWIAPLRRKQKKTFKYIQMHFDKQKYADEILDHFYLNQVFSSTCLMLNESTGFDIKYQRNKVFNLKLVAKTINGLVIKPGETFSFWWRARHADEKVSYKEGLITQNGSTTTIKGGGLCQMSNLLFWIFLHTPLTIVERHGHDVKDFKEPASDAPQGVDATVYEGWLDLQVRNDTDENLQIKIDFIDDKYIAGTILSDCMQLNKIKVVNGECEYYRKNGEIFEEVDVIKETLTQNNRLVSKEIAYRNLCVIAYKLDDDIVISERD